MLIATPTNYKLLMEEVKQILKCQPTASIIEGDPRKSDKQIALGWNVCYIVCGLIIQDNKVLMVQEAKPSCRGKWYLPAGRVEQKESLEDAVRREVKEEAGVDFEPEALIAVEFQSYRWVRFTFTGRVTGGQLKTPAQADKESIQAQWLPANVEQLTQEVDIRAYDCFQLIQIASEWYSEDVGHRYCNSIVPVSNTSSSLRIVLVFEDRDTIQVLIRDVPAGNTHLPGQVFGRYPALRHEISAALRENGYKGDFQSIGLLCVDHLVSGGDGIGLSILVKAKEQKLQDGCGFHWEPLQEPDVVQAIKTMLSSKYAIIQCVDLF